MTLDETITLLKFNNKHIADLKNDDLQQIAEWLEDYKRLAKETEQDIYERAYKDGLDKGLSDGHFFGYNMAIDDFEEAMLELEKYRTIGTVSELQDLVIGINALAGSQFSAADMAKLVNDMKSLYEYQQIGTPEECRLAVEKQQTMDWDAKHDECVCPKCATLNPTWKMRAKTVKYDKVYCWHCGQSVEFRLE